MSIRGTTLRLALPILMTGLVACSGHEAKEAPTPETSPGEMTYYPTGFNPANDPYWEDPRWQKTLLDTLQQAVRAPVDTSSISTPGLHATVKFTFENGYIEYPQIISGTGYPELDTSILHQVVSAQVPLPTTGLQIGQAHEFELDLDMPTPLDTFESTIYKAIEYWKVYPKNPILEGTVGDTTVAFDYQDGKASNIVMTISSKSTELDRSSVAAVIKATMPTAPAAYTGKSLHMEAVFCYTLVMADSGATPIVKNQCPVARNVIRVVGTRIKRVEIITH